MTDAVERTIDSLMAARGQPLAGDGLPVLRVADAYRVQAALVDRRGLEVGGWKLALVAAATLDAPLAATTIPASGVRPRRVPGRKLLIETELAVRLGRDLPGQATRYDRDDVLAAIDTLHPAVEVVCARGGKPPATPFPDFLADCLGNDATVVGRGFYPGAWPLIGALERDGENIAQRGHPAGDPLAALVAWTNPQSDALGGLRRGLMILLGSFTGIVAMPGTGPVAFRGLFAGLDAADVHFTDLEQA